MDRATLIGLAASLLGLIFIVELVRRRKLREDYSLLWLATGVVLVVLSAYRPLLDILAQLIGVVTYPPAALFLVAIIFMLFILLQFSLALTRLSRENKEAAQQMAIMRWELHEARKALGLEGVPDAKQPRDDQNQQQSSHIER